MSGFITNGELRIEAERLCDENERLQTENAKLREYVQMYYEALRHHPDGSPDWISDDVQDLRELGIEVSDG